MDLYGIILITLATAIVFLVQIIFAKTSEDYRKDLEDLIKKTNLDKPAPCSIYAIICARSGLMFIMLFWLFVVGKLCLV